MHPSHYIWLMVVGVVEESYSHVRVRFSFTTVFFSNRRLTQLHRHTFLNGLLHFCFLLLPPASNFGVPTGVTLISPFIHRLHLLSLPLLQITDCFPLLLSRPSSYILPRFGLQSTNSQSLKTIWHGGSTDASHLFV